MATPTQTLQAVLDYLNLPKGATEEDITLAIKARERKARASKGTPGVTKDGRLMLSGVGFKVWVDDLEVVEAGVKALREGIENNAPWAQDIIPKAEGMAARAERRAERKANK